MLLLVSGCITFSWHLCCAPACTPPGQWGLILGLRACLGLTLCVQCRPTSCTCVLCALLAASLRCHAFWGWWYVGKHGLAGLLWCHRCCCWGGQGVRDGLCVLACGPVSCSTIRVGPGAAMAPAAGGLCAAMWPPWHMCSRPRPVSSLRHPSDSACVGLPWLRHPRADAMRGRVATHRRRFAHAVHTVAVLARACWVACVVLCCPAFLCPRLFGRPVNAYMLSVCGWLKYVPGQVAHPTCSPSTSTPPDGCLTSRATAMRCCHSFAAPCPLSRGWPKAVLALVVCPSTAPGGLSILVCCVFLFARQRASQDGCLCQRFACA